MHRGAFNFRITIWTTSVVVFALIAILIIIQYFWVTAMLDMRKSMMIESIFLAFNESAYEIIEIKNEDSEDIYSYFYITHTNVPPEDVIANKSVISNTIQHYMDKQEPNVPYYWTVVKRNETEALIENDLFGLKDVKTPVHIYRISSMYQEFPYDLIIRFFNSRWQIPNVVYSTIFVLGFCFIILIAGILYNTRLYYKRQKETELWADFIGNMVHEFKTPMSTISLASEMMMRSNTISDPERIIRYSSLIYKENSHLKNMIDKLLQTISFDMNAAMTLNFVPIDIHEEIQRITEGFSLRIEEKKGTLTTNLQAKQPVFFGDKIHIFNALNSLVENAEKYSDGAPQIHIETKGDQNGLYLSVKDKGIGISSKHLKKLYNKFYRVRSDRSYSDSGYGLGLFYVNYVVRAHHGSIRVTSEEKIGSTFELYFPYKR